MAEILRPAVNPTRTDVADGLLRLLDPAKIAQGTSSRLFDRHTRGDVLLDFHRHVVPQLFVELATDAGPLQ
jgi:hypothetical protein